VDDEQWARIEAKRARNAYFRQLNEAAKNAKYKPPKEPRPVSRERLEQKPRKRRGPNNNNPKGRPRKTPTNCVSCGALLRMATQKAADLPGSKRHYGRGLCCNCYRRETGTTSWRRIYKENHG
jgi:hypothetical protein